MDDLISRREAIDALNEQIEYCNKALGSFDISPKDEYAVKVERASLEVYKEQLETLPSAQPEPHWIPVSERLPEELETVIITWKNHKPESYYSDIKDKPLTGVGIYHREKWWWWSAYAEDMLAEYGDSKADRMDEAIEVTAWMPLPEPYAERRADDLQ
jgi:hypothetical protein